MRKILPLHDISMRVINVTREETAKCGYISIVDIPKLKQKYLTLTPEPKLQKMTCKTSQALSEL